MSKFKVGDKVRFAQDYTGYWNEYYKESILTIKSCIKDELNNGFYMVTLEEIEEIHLINSLWLVKV